VAATASAPATAVEAPASAAAAPAPSSDHVDTPLSNMRKVIAARLTQSKQEVPHYYLTSKITVDTLMDVRKKFNGLLPDGEKLSINDFIIKACATALRQHPDVNSAWMDTFIRQYNYVDISIAVATPNGLITPILADADIKGLASIGREAQGLYAKAKEGKLQPHEFQGGTFTISNLGSFGISEFSAIVNPPQAVILAVGGIEDKVVPTGNDEAPFKATKVLTVTASLDHRVVDGAVGAQFLKTLKDLLEDPMKMLL
jgi:pyruvate dehydrogenase E2 component (dihydrolipoamide acetyltransferase)